RISILPPRCMRNVRSLTLWTVTPSTASKASTIAWAWLVSRAAQVTSIRSRSRPEEFTSSAVTAPPTRSTALVRLLTALARPSISRRTVIEYGTLGRLATGLSSLCLRVDRAARSLPGGIGPCGGLQRPLAEAGGEHAGRRTGVGSG